MKDLKPRNERELAEMLQVLKSEGEALGPAHSLSRAGLDTLDRLDLGSGTVHVGAGLALTRLETWLGERGLTLGPLPPHAFEQTLAEFLEGPYAGLRAITSGRLEPICVCLDAVMADGKVVRTHESPRSAMGPDLMALFLGGEGRLGLITSAVVRCFPQHSRRTVSFVLPEITAALRALRNAIADGCWVASVQLVGVEGKVGVSVELAGSDRGIAHDLETLQVCVTAGDGVPKHFERTASKSSGDRELNWASVRSEFEREPLLELHRLSLATVVALGEKAAKPGKWAAGTELIATLDPRRVLGGAP